ncbi:transposase [Sphingomonas carotinifaciens]|uniref:Transposase n=1 Tax=Sphingomonas carotinifaciens TaxID=1166323 RepID=A0A6N8LV82_9SPHN|nr:transposase [Sphingomonas carotinifaciens]
MASTPKGRLTDEFKREAVALWETSGRPQAEIAAGLGIVPTLLRRWQRKQRESSAPPASPATKPPVSTRASLADQASEIARLRLRESRRHLCGDAAVSRVRRSAVVRAQSDRYRLAADHRGLTSPLFFHPC